MRIKLWVVDLEDGTILEDLGTCLTDSPGRALQMYNEDQAWTDRGYHVDLCWKDITNQSAAALGSISTPKKAAASRKNGKLGGRPRKTDTGC